MRCSTSFSRGKKNSLGCGIATLPLIGLCIETIPEPFHVFLKRPTTGKSVENDRGAYLATFLNAFVCFEVLSKVFTTSFIAESPTRIYINLLLRSLSTITADFCLGIPTECIARRNTSLGGEGPE